jgi:hypothetical protein
VATRGKPRRIGTPSYYEEILRALNVERIRYLVVGGIAVILHGVPRDTADLDIMPDFDQGNMLRLVKVLGKLGLKPVIPEPPEAIANPENRARWIREKHMKVLTFQDFELAFRTVDVFVRHPVPFERAYACRRRVKLLSTVVPIAAEKDLIRMKTEAGRTRDLYDIAALQDLQRALRRKRK